MTESVDIPTGAVVALPADLAPTTAVESPALPGIVSGDHGSVFTVPLPGPPGKDGDDLSPEDLAELTETVGAEVQEDVNASLEPPIPFVLLFENALI